MPTESTSYPMCVQLSQAVVEAWSDAARGAVKLGEKQVKVTSWASLSLSLIRCLQQQLGHKGHHSMVKKVGWVGIATHEFLFLQE